MPTQLAQLAKSLQSWRLIVELVQEIVLPTIPGQSYVFVVPRIGSVADLKIPRETRATCDKQGFSLYSNAS